MIESASTTAEYSGHLKGFSVMSKSQTNSSTPIINYCWDFRENWKTLTSSTPTNNYYRGLREGLKTLISSAHTNNYCRGLRDDISDITFFSIKPVKTGYTF